MTAPPKTLCILRLSALGDISHLLPIIRTIACAWPQTKITWIIGKTEAQLVSDIAGIEFIVFDKSRGWRAYCDLKKQIKGRRFDVLLHMQVSLRASLATRLIPAKIKVGFDRQRAKDLQWLFTNRKITHKPQQHVIDSFFGFIETLGIDKRTLEWDIPIPDEARRFAQQQLKSDRKTLIISPCSSVSYRNWNSAGYAAVADYAIEKHQMQVLLCGGSSAIEQHYGERICTLAKQPITNLIGKTQLKQLLAVLHCADIVIAPDSGPAHLATAVGTPVIGLYACTNPDRARPYLSADYVVSHYREAVFDKYGKAVEELPWGIRVHDEGTMDRIKSSEVTERLDLLLSQINKKQSI